MPLSPQKLQYTAGTGTIILIPTISAENIFTFIKPFTVLRLYVIVNDLFTFILKSLIMKTRLLIAGVLFCFISISASAQNGNRTLRYENRRIQQDHIKREAIRYKANDGRIGPRERADLRRDQKRLDRNIRHQKHDRQRRH